MAQKMRLRSQVPLSERNAENVKKEAVKIKTLAPLKYPGKVVYITTYFDTAVASEKLLKLAADCKEDFIVVGFDLEWPFSFQTGSGKVATMQISPSLEGCFIFQFSAFSLVPGSNTGLPRILLDFLSHPKVRLTGVNIKNDIRKLGRDFRNVPEEAIIGNCIELSTLANTKLSFTKRWSLEALVGHFLLKQINKNKRVRMSQWNVYPLTVEQQAYAAIDAFASLELYFIINNYVEVT